MISPRSQGFKIFINRRNIIELAYIGELTPETVEASLVAAQEHIQQLQVRGQPARFLIDYGQIGKTTIAANRRALRGMHELKFKKMAGINAKPVIRFITNSIARITRDSDRARHFNRRKEAEEWLLKP